MNPITRTRLLPMACATISVLALGGILGSACGYDQDDYNDDRGLGDAPASQVDDAVVPVWPGPNGFHNVAAYCIGTDAIYTHTRVAPPVVVGSSPNCEPGGLLADVRPMDARTIENAPGVSLEEDG